MTPEEFRLQMEVISRNLDLEMSHLEADELMTHVLRLLGYEDGVDVYDSMEKVYV